MPKLVFYRQKRQDGAIRTGLELDDDPIAEHYEEGSGERDPVLLWFVDLRCKGTGIPGDPVDAEAWLLEHSDIIRTGFARFAERLRAGVDPDLYSVTWSEFDGVPTDVEMIIACSAVRRVDAREVALYVADVGIRWDELIRSLAVPLEAQGLG